jgi:hypothetical protein
MAVAFVDMMQRFGGPTPEDPGTEQTRQIWEAFKAVYEVKVLEGSTSYMDPASDQQSSMQLYTTMVQSFPIWMQLAAKQLVPEVPNMTQFVNDMLRAFSRQNVEAYWEKAPSPPAPSTQIPPDLVKAMQAIYKEVPPDVRRQIEQTIGLQPSKTGETPEQPDQIRVEDPNKQIRDHVHEARLQKSQHLHDMRTKLLDLAKERAKMDAERERTAVTLQAQASTVTQSSQNVGELPKKKKKRRSS